MNTIEEKLVVALESENVKPETKRKSWKFWKAKVTEQDLHLQKVEERAIVIVQKLLSINNVKIVGDSSKIYITLDTNNGKDVVIIDSVSNSMRTNISSYSYFKLSTGAINTIFELVAKRTRMDLEEANIIMRECELLGLENIKKTL